MRIATPRPFDWSLAVRGHGWYQLAPFQWDPDAETLSFALMWGEAALEVRLRHDGEAILGSVESDHPLSRASVLELRARIRRMFRLDEDLVPFWKTCAKTPRMRWVARSGAGRLLRAPTLFEDQLKILFTTNCTWTNTQHMSAALVDALGARGPTGRRAFPSAAVCARKSPAWWRARIRVGYRAEACAHLSRLAAKGDDRLDPTARAEPTRDVRALRKALQERPGFGPYAAGQALRLLGHYDDLALDAAVRSHLSEGRSDAELCADYTSFGAFAGLALWMDFSRRWLDHPKVPAPVRKGRR